MMRIRPIARTALLSGAVAALLACGGEQGPANNGANAAINEAGATANAAAPAENAADNVATSASAALSAGYMVGKWSAMNEDCSATLEFRKDGTVATPLGDGKWTLTGDQLAIDYGEGSSITPSTIKPVGPDRIEITTASGRKETQKRC